MAFATLAIFSLTYLGLAVGRIPGLALDRTGFAVLGAALMIATGAVSLEEAKAAVDAPTLAVLFGMMLLSAQYRLSGLYTAIADRIAKTKRPGRLVAAAVLAVAALSAVLTNDVVCLAMTPLLAPALLRARLDPVPVLIALACASNIGSALTPIGNPQNILIAQALHLPFARFVLIMAPAVILALVLLVLFVRRRAGAAFEPDPRALEEAERARRPLDRPQALKALLLTAGVIAFFLTPVPAHLTALGLAGLVLLSRRMHSREMLGLVDWHLLALFVALFVVMEGFRAGGWPDELARVLGFEPGRAPPALPFLAAAVLLSLLVGNVPAVIAVLPFVPKESGLGYGLALASTMAGNALIAGSVANIIVVEQAARLGVAVSFRRHLAIGLPVTLASLALTAATLAVL